MVNEGIVLGHKVPANRIEVKTAAIEKLIPPKNVKEARSFLGHLRFYMKIIRPRKTIVIPSSECKLQQVRRSKKIGRVEV